MIPPDDLREQLGDYEQALANYQRSWNLNRMNSQVAERIAMLNRSLSGGVDATPPNGTRTVVTPSPVMR